MVKLIHRQDEWEIVAGMTVRDAILKVGLNPEAVLAVRDGQIINEDTKIQDDDVVKLIAVVSGG
ncbi:MAG: MoaD/ThiS family protein [Chloroflexota bacterium]